MERGKGFMILKENLTFGRGFKCSCSHSWWMVEPGVSDMKRAVQPHPGKWTLRVRGIMHICDYFMTALDSAWRAVLFHLAGKHILFQVSSHSLPLLGSWFHNHFLLCSKEEQTLQPLLSVLWALRLPCGRLWLIWLYVPRAWYTVGA